MNEYRENLRKATIGVLQGARDLITDPAHWTTRALARRASGVETAPADRDAVCWCAIGAMSWAAHDSIPIVFSQEPSPKDTLRPDARFRAHMAFEEACQELYDTPIASYVNDNFGHAKVLAGFDKAIVTLQG